MSAAHALLVALRAKADADFSHRGETTRWCFGDRCGERHALTLRFEDRGASARFLRDLGEHEFALPGHFVAEIAAVPACRGIDVEALTFAKD